MMLQAELSKNDIKIQAKDVFDYPTADKLYKHISGGEKNYTENYDFVSETCLTPAQEYVYDISSPENSHFAMASFFEVPFHISNENILCFVRQLIRENDMLKVRFSKDGNGNIRQEICEYNEEINLPVKVIKDISELNDLTIIQKEVDSLAKAMDVAIGKTIRGTIYEDLKGSKLLIIAIHYLCADGMLWRLID